MVDGIAAVELGSLLLDPTPESGCVPTGRLGGRARAGRRATARAGRARPRSASSSACCAGRCALRRRRRAPLQQTAAGVLRMTRALSHSLRAAPASVLNRQLSPLRQPGVDPAPARRPASRQAHLRHDGQRRDAGRRRRRHARISDPPRRAAGGAEGDGAGQRAQRGRRPRQPHLVRVRRAALRRARPARPSVSGARHDDPAQARRRARGSRPRAEGRGSCPDSRAADAVAIHRQPAHVQPRGVQHPRACRAAVHARLSASRPPTRSSRSPTVTRSRWA